MGSRKSLHPAVSPSEVTAVGEATGLRAAEVETAVPVATRSASTPPECRRPTGATAAMAAMGELAQTVAMEATGDSPLRHRNSRPLNKESRAPAETADEVATAATVPQAPTGRPVAQAAPGAVADSSVGAVVRAASAVPVAMAVTATAAATAAMGATGLTR